MERITLLVVPREGPVSFVVPRLEAQKASATPIVQAGHAEVIPFEETDDAPALVADLLASRQLAAGDAAWEPIGLSDRLWAMHVLALAAVLPGRRFESASAVMRDLRQVKDADEARLLSLAAAAADRTVDTIASGRLIGRTEAEVAREVRRRLIDEGHDVADFAIVGSGPNSASSHHDAGDRVIAAGEPVVLDIGGTLAGYCSDITRTVWVGGDAGSAPEPEFGRVFELVREAQAKATAAVAPGVPAEQIDAAARAVIAAGGAAQTHAGNGRITAPEGAPLARSDHNGLFASGTLGRYSKVLNSVLEGRVTR